MQDIKIQTLEEKNKALTEELEKLRGIDLRLVCEMLGGKFIKEKSE